MVKILLAGHCSLDPLGRHIISFIKCLLANAQNKIFVERDSLLGDEVIFKTLFKDEIRKNKIQFAPEDINEIYDFLIFTDSFELHPGQNWGQPFFSKKAKIKICYPVYDGSVPPLHWIEIINNNFDLCLCVSDYCAHNLKRYGVKVDCCCLECAILIEDFLKLKPNINNKKIFRFGSIGASDFRKNMPLLIRSFSKAFSKDDPVELFIHSSYGKDISCQNDIMDAYNECKEKSNIHLQLKKISHKEMIELYASFDAYISPQTTTGYFTTPVEACAAGIPIILSDIHPHLELKKFIPEENNLFYVPHKIISSAYHWVFDYLPLGCKFEGKAEDYVQAMQNVYSNRKKLYEKKYIFERKKNAEKLSAKILSKKYNTLFYPEKIIISNETGIDGEKSIFYMSEKLRHKYNKNVNTIKQNTRIDTALYIEEKDEVFIALEKSSVEMQKIFIKKYNIQEETNKKFFANCIGIRKTIYLFGIIPILKIRKNEKKIKYNLFSFIPLLKIAYRNSSKLISLCGIPFLKIKEKNK